jgi:hypothetical protein
MTKKQPRAPLRALFELELVARRRAVGAAAARQEVAHVLVVDLEVRRAHEELARAAFFGVVGLCFVLFARSEEGGGRSSHAHTSTQKQTSKRTTRTLPRDGVKDVLKRGGDDAAQFRRVVAALHSERLAGARLAVRKDGAFCAKEGGTEACGFKLLRTFTHTMQQQQQKNSQRTRTHNTQNTTQTQDPRAYIPLYPSKTASTIGRAARSNTSRCADASPNTPSNANAFGGSFGLPLGLRSCVLCLLFCCV